MEFPCHMHDQFSVKLAAADVMNRYNIKACDYYVRLNPYLFDLSISIKGEAAVLVALIGVEQIKAEISHKSALIGGGVLE